MSFSSYPSKGGIPGGNTSARPSGPAVGDTFYNGETAALEIWTGSNWVPCSSPAATPTLNSVTDVGTGRAFGNGALTVAVTASSSGGATLGFYAYANNTTTSSATSPITVTGLSGGTTYDVTAAAYNGFGASAPTGVVTGTPTTVPDAVGAPTVTAGIGSLGVVWSAPATGGKSITEYTATAYDATLTAISTGTTTETSITLTGLTAGTYYTVKVKAQNANGYGVFGTASSSVTPIASFNADVLVVAGGGGGGSGNGFESGAGAGAGGFRTNSSFAISGPFTVTVGAGGAKSTVNNVVGGKGGTSTLGTISSTGGGYGGTYTSSGGNGGSGGGRSAGGTNGTGNEGGYTPVEGYSGAYSGGGSTSSYKGGGGGGGGAASSGNQGGLYATYSITGSSVQYAGGGSGGGNLDGSSGAPSIGGGGGAGTTGNGGDATANTGGGGAGGSGQYGSTGGNGGAGVVILAYPNSIPAPASIGAGLTYDTPTRSGYRVYRFTAGTGTVTF